MLITNSIVPCGLSGLRFDIALTHLFPHFSRAQLTKWLKEGIITCNNDIIKPKAKVKGGEQVAVAIDCVNAVNSNEPEQAEKIPLAVIYEDDDLLVLNKPAGLVVHPGAGNKRHTLVNALLYHNSALRHLTRAGIVHRLDKDTTGLLIVAKTLIAYTNLVRQMQARMIKRQYLALVQGSLISGEQITTYYGRDHKNRLKMAVRSTGKLAITSYAIEKRFKKFTLLNITLHTGRTHQIRVHMAHIKHPIVGDLLYNSRRYFYGANVEINNTRLSYDSEQTNTIQPQPLLRALGMATRLQRQLLHAYKISLTHPLTGEFLTFTTPMPEDFKLFLCSCDESDE